MSVLDFQQITRGASARKDEYFDFLEPFVQPGSQTSAADIVTELMERLRPRDETYTIDNTVNHFFTVIRQMSTQIPYDHPSMDKLVDILDVFMEEKHVKRLEDFGLPAGEAPEMFSAHITEFHDLLEEEMNREYTNESSFLARIDAVGLPYHQPCPDGVRRYVYIAFAWQHRDSFERRQGRVMGAAQWIMFCGREAFDCFLHPEAYPDNHDPHGHTMHHWRVFRQGFEAFANGDRDHPKFTYSEECKKMASRAAARMSLIEREAGVEFLAFDHHKPIDPVMDGELLQTYSDESYASSDEESGERSRPDIKQS